MTGVSSVARMFGLVVLLLPRVCSLSSALPATHWNTTAFWPEPVPTAGVAGGDNGADAPKTEWISTNEDQPFVGGGPETGAIVGGTPNATNWPWIALLSPMYDPNVPVCGGSLINSRHVLTAAHCLDTFKRNDLVVRLGKIDRTTTESSSSDYNVSQVIVHPNYVKGAGINDIALLQLSEEVQFSASVCSIALPTGPTGDLANSMVTVAGWGSTTNRSGPYSHILKEADLYAGNVNQCEGGLLRSLPDNSYPAGFLAKTKLCAISFNNMGVCAGDSGGPVVEHSRRRLVGVVSEVSGVACGNAVNVFTRVSAYLDWIRRNANMEQPINQMHHCGT